MLPDAHVEKRRRLTFASMGHHWKLGCFLTVECLGYELIGGATVE